MIDERLDPDETNEEIKQHCEALGETLAAGQQQLAFLEAYEGGGDLLRLQHLPRHIHLLQRQHLSRQVVLLPTASTRGVQRPATGGERCAERRAPQAVCRCGGSMGRERQVRDRAQRGYGMRHEAVAAAARRGQPREGRLRSGVARTRGWQSAARTSSCA